MAKLIPFPARRVHRTAEIVLLLASSREMLCGPVPWSNRPATPEALGNMLQRLALVRPTALLVLESVVADILAQIAT
jgi:hypothetical protein